MPNSVNVQIGENPCSAFEGATFNGTTFNFDIEYNTVGRIISRDIAYDFGAELAFDIDERFNYVN